MKHAHYGSAFYPQEGTQSIGLEVRLIDGVPVLFTERGELIRGQREVIVRGAVDEAVSAQVDILLTRAADEKSIVDVAVATAVSQVGEQLRRGRM